MTQKSNRKVSIVGAGAVGASIAFALVQSNQLDELSIIDIAEDQTKGEVLDLIDASAFSGATKISGGSDYKLCKDSDIIIITAGAAQKVGETRIDLVKKNAAIMKSIVKSIIKHNKTALLVVVSNPVDILTTVAMQASGFEPERVIGTGTFLDTGRAREAIAKELGLHSNDVEAYVLGEHGDTQFIPWSLAATADEAQSIASLSAAKRKSISESTKKKAYEIIKLKGATYYGIASAVELLVTHVYEESPEPLPLSTYQEADNGNGFHITCSLVCVTLEGVVKSAVPDLEPAEQKLLQKSVDALREVLKEVSD